jgi:hypothetical protein
VKGDMTGRSLTGRIIIFGGEAFWRGGHFGGGDWISVWIFSGVESFDIGSFSEPLQGHRVAGGFGHGDQDSFQFPGAREPDRLLLAGWEVSRLGRVGQCIWLGKAARKGQPDQWGN